MTLRCTRRLRLALLKNLHFRLFVGNYEAWLLPSGPVILLSNIHTVEQSSITDQVFDTLLGAIVALELPPGSKVSEAEIAKSLNVSRQPVRDAFFRLSKLGFLSIRPQRASLVSKISEEVVKDAVFVRFAIESACIRVVIDKISVKQLDGLSNFLEQQQLAIDSNYVSEFRDLDKCFHQRICELSGHYHVWGLIKEKKAHMDRVRRLATPRSGQVAALAEHIELIEALRSGRLEAAEACLSSHLYRIVSIMRSIRPSNERYFVGGQGVRA